MPRQNDTHWGLEEAFDPGRGGSEVRELPLGRGAFPLIAIVAVLFGLIIVGRVFWLSGYKGGYYQALAGSNVERQELIEAPRGKILDAEGRVLAENAPAFALQLAVRPYLAEPEERRNEVLSFLRSDFGVDVEELRTAIREHVARERGEPLTLVRGLIEAQVVQLESHPYPGIQVAEGYVRRYPYGADASSVIGYTGAVSSEDLAEDDTLLPLDVIGRQGVEASYDTALRGQFGERLQPRNARGEPMGEERTVPALSGDDLHLTIDAELQKYVAERLRRQLASLGRTSGAALALDPRDGAIRALVSLPSYDPDVFSDPTRSDERVAYLTDKDRPLYNRIISGVFTPGSTIKPLVGLAVLVEKVVSPEWGIFSPGYLDIPNPYDPSKPTRYVDWRFQGWVTVRSAIAQSSNVYFYATGGGTGGLKGLGIVRLREWWQRFLLDKRTGVDLPSEGVGFLPSIEWKEEVSGTPWRIGDTYNVSIGQGDLSITPIALGSYIAAVANGGKIYRPYVSQNLEPLVQGDLSEYAEELKIVQEGMRQTVTSDKGTAKLLKNLPFEAAGKTGSAQIQNNQKENAFFVGYAPYQNPELAIVILVEDAVQGSSNAVPVGRDVFDFWWGQRSDK